MSEGEEEGKRYVYCQDDACLLTGQFQQCHIASSTPLTVASRAPVHPNVPPLYVSHYECREPLRPLGDVGLEG